jgi:hypothetical protein
LIQTIRTSGPIQLSTHPPLSLILPTVSNGNFLETMLNMNQAKDVLEAVNGFVALSYEYDPSVLEGQGQIRNTLNHALIALQLVKPTRYFGEYWFLVDDTGRMVQFSSELTRIHLSQSEPYLWYQQHNTITLEDVETVKRCLPRLLHAFAPAGSWSHPCGPVHRALVMFAEGYLTEMFGELRQFLWAMALDCLFSSKTDRKKRGAHTIDQRLRMLLGAEFEPYSAVSIAGGPSRRPIHKLFHIAKDIFTLRNACAHGLTITEYVGVGTPVAATGKAPGVISKNAVLAALVMTGAAGAPTVRVKFCVALGNTSLEAVMVRG